MIFYYGQLSHFLIELNAVKRQGELRNKLFLELFSHPLEHWRGRFDALYFDADRSGNMREQLETYERLKVAMVNLVGKRK